MSLYESKRIFKFSEEDLKRMFLHYAQLDGGPVSIDDIDIFLNSHVATGKRDENENILDDIEVVFNLEHLRYEK